MQTTQYLYSGDMGQMEFVERNRRSTCAADRWRYLEDFLRETEHTPFSSTCIISQLIDDSTLSNYDCRNLRTHQNLAIAPRRANDALCNNFYKKLYKTEPRCIESLVGHSIKDHVAHNHQLSLKPELATNNTLYLIRSFLKELLNSTTVGMVESKDEELKEETAQLSSCQMEATNQDDSEEPTSSSAKETKEPGRLFEEGDGDSELEISLKDYEDAKLKELEIERRRIIENQVVRRKKIFRWPFHNQQNQKEGNKKQTSIAGVLQSLKHYKKKKPPPSAKIHFIDTEEEMKLSPIVQESLGKHWETSRAESTTPETEPPQDSTDPVEQEKQDEEEDLGTDKMSEQDLINFDGAEHCRMNGDITPGIEVTPPEDEEKQVTEEVPEAQDEKEVVAEEASVVSTASIDLTIVDSVVDTPAVTAEEEKEEVSVEFEQLELSDKPVSSAPVANDIRNEMEPKFTKTAKRPTSNHAAESKIAMEIREMREREEELRKMRDRLVSKVDTQPEITNESFQSDGSTKSEDFVDDGRGSPNTDFRNKKNVTRAVSLDSLHGGQTYNVGYAFGHRRKDEIKVKPLEDGENDNETKQRYRALKESPIEREIRLTREREDALRKEKGIVENKEDKRQLQKSIRNAKIPEPPIVHADTQRLLATSRIQQEIQEQTRREMALRESGHIQTISQERTDSKVTKIRESVNSPSNTNTIEKKRSPSPTVDIYEKTNGHSVNGNNKSPSPPNSNSSSTNVVPPGRRLSNPQAPGRGISMQRFIKSKGKDIGFAAFPGSYKENVVTDYYEIRPPQLRRVNGHSGPIAPRRCVTAESKIQEELKEMKAREDELRKQRARLLGLSQPNLSLLVTDDDLVTNGDQESNLDRSNSNPNLLDDHSNGALDGTDEQDSGFGSIKRRSNLIAQWEQRIQKAEAKS